MPRTMRILHGYTTANDSPCSNSPRRHSKAGSDGAEIIDIISDKTDNGERINAIADEFRRGRDTRELLPLLRSENAEVVCVATWILSEIPEKFYSSHDFVSALHNLTAHADASVRWEAFGALYPFLDAGDPATRALLARLSQDENVGMRQRAEAATARLGIVCN